jgi:2-polyprenyl-3-methyl-5-hydroxy-6-metoxy-1,4-benzoquinol methylase
MMQTDRQTHLEYYREHQIAPVRYDLSNIDAHLERRFSLYIKLGLPPLCFADASVLEVAAGTGHNSVYLAQLLPSKLVLLEPNEVAINYIRNTYQAFEKPHTTPDIICETLEVFSPTKPFDIVICENWLGTSAHETTLLAKLANSVEKNGIMVLTTVSPIGFVPNLLRRLLSLYLAPDNKSFAERTEILTSAFSSHLKTLTHMTRNHIDWVQDNMLNPAYFTLCLSIPMVIEQLGQQFLAYGSLPTLSEDWRWFKGLHGDHSQSNLHFLNQYWQKAHNFLDYREATFADNTDNNHKLEMTALALLDAVATHENWHLTKNTAAITLAPVIKALDDFIVSVPPQFVNAIAGLQEVRHMLEEPASIQINTVKAMSCFAGLFGRETAYLSLTRMK